MGLSLAGENADRARKPRRIDAGILQRLDRAFEKHPLLRIDEFGLARAVLEVFGIEHFEAGKRSRGPHVARQLQERVRHSGLPEFVIGPERDEFDPVAHIVPELVDIGRAGTANRHPDNRNTLRGVGIILLVHNRLVHRARY